MTKGKRVLLIFCLILVAVGPYLVAQEQQDGITPGLLVQLAAQAHQQGKYDVFLSNLQQAHKLDSVNPIIQYNMACGFALTGQPDSAMYYLWKLGKQKIDFNMQNDADLASLRHREDYKQLEAYLAEALKPVSTSEQFVVIEQADLCPEGIAYDPVSERFFVGSMRHGTILAVDKSGKATPFATLSDEIGYSTLGLHVDTERSLLWACGFPTVLHERFSEENVGTSAMFAFDLKTGEVEHKIKARGLPPGAGFNDVVVTKSGMVYIGGGNLMQFRIGDTAVVPVKTDHQFHGANGLTLSPDEKTLFVSDFNKGIVRVDLATGKAAMLEKHDTLPLAGVDGMYFHENSLVAIQLSAPWKVVRFFLSPAMTSVDSAQVFEFNNKSLPGATTGAIVGDDFYYVARGVAPETLPDGFPETFRPAAGKTVIMRTKLTQSPM